MHVKSSLKEYTQKYDDILQNNEKVAKELEDLKELTDMTISKLSGTFPSRKATYQPTLQLIKIFFFPIVTAI